MPNEKTISKFSRGKDVSESEVIMIDDKPVLITDDGYDFRIFTLEQIVEELNELKFSSKEHNLNTLNVNILESVSKYFQDMVDNLK